MTEFMSLVPFRLTVSTSLFFPCCVAPHRPIVEFCGYLLGAGEQRGAIAPFPVANTSRRRPSMSAFQRNG